MNHDNTKGIPIHESLWMPRTCGLIHPLFNYSGDHQCHGYCMILWCWGCPNGRTDLECPVHVDSPTPCLIILVTINPMNIMVPKVSWWMNFSTYGLTHPLINYSDLIWDHARGPKQIETVYHGPAAPFPWTCSAGDGAFGLQQCCSQLCKNLAVHAGSSSRSCARTRVRNHGCSIPRRNTRQHNELKQLKLNHGV